MNRSNTRKIYFRDDSVEEEVERKRKHQAPDSFQNAIGPIIVVAQCLGIMPVIGILTNDRNAVKFKWMAVRTIYSLLVLTGGISELMLTIYRIHNFGLNLINAESLTFFSITTTGQIFFINLARRWPKLIRCWDRAESIFLTRPYRTHGWRLDCKMKILCFIWVALAASEYSGYVTMTLIGINGALNECPGTNVTIQEVFFESQRTHIFYWIRFHDWMIPFLLLINMSLTFCWTYLDLFIMLVGISLAARFNQVTDRIKRMENMIIPESFWTEIRSHYLLLNELVLYVDDRLSLILLLSCASNLYFVCLQLFNSFTSNYSDVISTVFFWYSLLFVMGRAVCVILCVSSINEASKGSLRILRTVPTKHWSIELARFASSISKDTIALTGRKFFYITKRLILVMAGTVVTYELVVFDQVDKDNASAGETGTHPCNWTFRQYHL
uniref:Gustatory receptor n=1 Tax=Phlebotomus papatasi TaxID=29031 RepID=A0A240SYM8_PHLPP